ncbi:MAG: hypothetical protein IJV22_00040 [Bacteroidales bacterium]|nr:hypothetical protein [Bacteroidales bacterium]
MKEFTSSRAWLTLTICLLFCAQLGAQGIIPRLDTVMLGMNTSKSIIRNFGQDHVAYLETDAGKFIALLRNDTTLLTYPISNDLEIRDMDVSGAYLYYCGVDWSVDRAIVGWIRIYDLYGGILNNHCHWNEFVNQHGTEVKELNKLKVVWRTSNGAGDNFVTITAVGSATNVNIGEHSSCVLSVLIKEGNTSCTWPYLVEYGRGICQIYGNEDFDNSYPGEVFTDVTVTDNYVVVASALQEDWMYLNLRIRERSSGLVPLCDTSMIIVPNYEFGLTYEFPLDKFLICGIDNDILAIVSKKGLGPDQDDGYLLNLIDVNDAYQHLQDPGTLSAFHPMQTLALDYIIPSATNDLMSLCYSNNLLYLITFSDLPWGSSTILSEIDPYGGTINIDYTSDYQFQSVCPSPWGCTTMGINFYEPNFLTFHHQAPYAPAGCIPPFSYGMIQGIDYEGKEQPDFLNRFTFTSNPVILFITSYATEHHLNNLCY